MDYEHEPMDIDLSNTSIHPMDISYNEIDSETPQITIKEEPCDSEYIDNKGNAVNDCPTVSPTVIKRFYLNVPSRKGKMPFISNNTLPVVFTILAFVSILIYQTLNIECSKELDLAVLKQSLYKNLFGQPQAIEDIIDMMETRSSSKILLLYGGTGVGKTLTVSLILENLYHYANIYHYTMPTFIDSFSANLLLGLTLCPTSMIIVDDLNRTDVHIKDHINKFIEKSENLNKNITIILVYNCDTINDKYIKRCDNSFYTDLKESFSDIKALKRYIKFRPLTEEHLRRCIERELGNNKLSEEDYREILKNFNVSIDGCKGVHTKVKLLNL